MRVRARVRARVRVVGAREPSIARQTPTVDRLRQPPRDQRRTVLRLHLQHPTHNVHHQLHIAIPSRHPARHHHLALRLRPHIEPGQPHIVRHQPRFLRHIPLHRIRHVLERPNIPQLGLGPVVRIGPIRQPGVFLLLALQLPLRQLLPHMIAVNQRPVQRKPVLPMPLQRTELADRHLARPTLLRRRPPTHLTRHHQLRMRIARQTQTIKLVQQDVFPALRRPLRNRLDVPKLQLPGPRIVHLPPMWVAQDLVRVLNLRERLGVTPFVRMMDFRLLTIRRTDLQRGRCAGHVEGLVERVALDVLHLFSER